MLNLDFICRVIDFLGGYSSYLLQDQTVFNRGHKTECKCLTMVHSWLPGATGKRYSQGMNMINNCRITYFSFVLSLCWYQNQTDCNFEHCLLLLLFKYDHLNDVYLHLTSSWNGFMLHVLGKTWQQSNVYIQYISLFCFVLNTTEPSTYKFQVRVCIFSNHCVTVH